MLASNGAGKTTYISIIAGLIRVGSGSVLVHGHDVMRETLCLQSGYLGLPYFGRLAGQRLELTYDTEICIISA